jgi:hypothetical protein
MAVGAWVWGSVADWQDLPTALHCAAGFLVVSLIGLRIVAPMPEMHVGQRPI